MDETRNINSTDNPLAILIVTEDKKSSMYYFQSKIKSLGLENRSDVKIDLEGLGKAPVTLVNYTFRKIKNQFDEFTKHNTYKYREIYCIMDVDDHSSLEKAIQRIASFNQTNKFDCKVYPIISNECFEIWYLLHFIDYSTKELYRGSKAHHTKNKIFVPDNRNIDKLLANYLGEEYRKMNDDIFKQLILSGGKESQAIEFAKRLEKYFAANFPGEPVYLHNPCTQVYFLVEKLNHLSGLLKKNRMLFKMGEVGEKYMFKDHEFMNILFSLIDRNYCEVTNNDDSENLSDHFKRFIKE